MKKWILFIVCITSFYSCAQHISTAYPVPGNNQNRLLYQGTEYIVSKDKNLLLCVGLTRKTFIPDRSIGFQIVIKNESKQHVDFFVRDISLGCGSQILKVFTYYDLEAAVIERRKQEHFNNSLRATYGAMNMMNGGSPTTYNGSVYSVNSGNTYQYQATLNPDPFQNAAVSASMINEANNNETNQRIASDYELRNLWDSYLKDTTLFPGQVCTGELQAKAPYLNNSGDIILYVTVGQLGLKTFTFKTNNTEQSQDYMPSSE